MNRFHANEAAYADVETRLWAMYPDAMMEVYAESVEHFWKVGRPLAHAMANIINEKTLSIFEEAYSCGLK